MSESGVRITRLFQLTKTFASLGYRCSALDDSHVLALYP